MSVTIEIFKFTSIHFLCKVDCFLAAFVFRFSNFFSAIVALCARNTYLLRKKDGKAFIGFSSGNERC